MKKIISLLLTLIMLVMCFSACNDPEVPAEGTDGGTEESSRVEESTEAPEDEALAVAEGKAGKLYIVMPKTQCLNTVYAKDKLVYFVKNTTGATLKTGSLEKEFELLLGDTGRPESTALMAELSGDQYIIKIEGSKIIIVASNPAFLYDAVECLIEEYLTVADDKILLNVKTASLEDSGDKTSLRYLFTQSKMLYADNYRSDGWPDEIVKIPAGGATHLQGGGSDGEYIYQAFIKKDSASNEVNNICTIVKVKPDFDPKGENVVLTSENLDLNHTNDITYNSKTHELVVSHNNPYRTKLSVLDPDTLTVKRTLEIPQKIYAISYSPERDQFVVGCSGGQTMRMLSGDMTEMPEKVYQPTSETEGMTTQGICSDDTFIYHTLWNTKGTSGNYNKNVVTVYDWYGNYVGMIGTKITIESENILIYNQKLYVCAHSSGGKASYIYRIDPKVK